MTKTAIEDHGDVCILRLDNGPTNAINPIMVENLGDALQEIRKKYKGTVLAGGEKFFCIGFDLPYLLTLDWTGLSDFFYKFNEVIFELFCLPIPSACAMAGHATAGGSILALACDYRFGAPGKKLIGLNEVKLGLPVPYLPVLILKDLVGSRVARDMLYRGEFMTLADAEKVGLVDRIYPPEELEARAVESVSGLTALPQAAFAAIKADRTEAIRLRYENNHKAKNEKFLECWFSRPVQELLQETSKKF